VRNKGLRKRLGAGRTKRRNFHSAYYYKNIVLSTKFDGPWASKILLAAGLRGE
jgi:hypothetical protein